MGMIGTDGHEAVPADGDRSLTFLNGSGDGTLSWGPDLDDTMRDLISAKMREGYAFFTLERRLGGLLTTRRRVEDVDKAMASRTVTMSDRDFAAVVTSGGAALCRRDPEATHDALRGAAKCNDPAVVASSHSVAVRGMAGG